MGRIETTAPAMMFPKAYADAVAKLRVPGGFLLVTAFCLLANPTQQSILLSLPLSLAGLMLRAWAAGHLVKNQKLARDGPYALVRNPLYAGTLLVAAGLVIAARRWELMLLFSAVFGLVYLPVIQLEEQHLHALFADFEDYCREVPLLIPRGKHPRKGSRFSWALYRKNEEYNALLGYLAGLGWLFWLAGKTAAN